VQNAVSAASAGATVKIAGTCAGVQIIGGLTQTVWWSTNRPSGYYPPEASTRAGGFLRKPGLGRTGFFTPLDFPDTVFPPSS
jgi:hypothetical protein